MAERVEMPVRSWRLRRQYYSLESRDGKFPPRDTHLERTPFIPQGPSYGTVTYASEIGTRKGKREFVIEVDLDSGFKDKLLYEGDVRIDDRVKIDEIRVGNGTIKKASMISLAKKETPDSFTISLPLKIPEASMSSK